MADKQSHGKEGGFKERGRKLKMVKGRPKVLRKECLETRQRKEKGLIQKSGKLKNLHGCGP